MIITFKSRFLLLIQVLVIFAISPLALLFLVPVASAEISEPVELVDPTTLIKEKIIGLPSLLIIPKINVSASIEHVGLTASGVMGASVGPKNASWFSEGPRPGEIGSAVINGHYGWKDGIPAVFDRLNTLIPGDKIYVVDEAGATTTFMVRESTSFDQNAEAFGVFNSDDGKAHLNLITCEGTWNKLIHKYSNRLVVFADEI